MKFGACSGQGVDTENPNVLSPLSQPIVCLSLSRKSKEIDVLPLKLLYFLGINERQSEVEFRHENL